MEQPSKLVENDGAKVKRQQSKQPKLKWRSQSVERDKADHGSGGTDGHGKILVKQTKINSWKWKSSTKGKNGREPLVAFDVLIEVLRFLHLQSLVAFSGRVSRSLFWASLRHPTLSRVHQPTQRIGRPLMLSLHNIRQPNGVITRRWKCYLFFAQPELDGGGRWEEAQRYPNTSLDPVLSGIHSVRALLRLSNVTLNNVATFVQPFLDALRVSVPIFLRTPSECSRPHRFLSLAFSSRWESTRGIVADAVRHTIEVFGQCLQMVPASSTISSSFGRMFFHHVVLHFDTPEMVVSTFRPAGNAGNGNGAQFLSALTNRLTIVGSGIESYRGEGNFLRWNYAAVEALAYWLQSPTVSIIPRTEDETRQESTDNIPEERVVVLMGQSGNAITGNVNADSISLIVTGLKLRFLSMEPQKEETVSTEGNNVASTSSAPIIQKQAETVHDPQPYSVIFAVKRSLLAHCPQPFQRLDQTRRHRLTLSIHGPQPLVPLKDRNEKAENQKATNTAAKQQNHETGEEKSEGEGFNGEVPSLSILQPIDANPDLELRRLQQFIYGEEMQEYLRVGRFTDESVWLVLRHEVFSEGKKKFDERGSPPAHIFPPTLDPSYAKTLTVHYLENTQLTAPPRFDTQVMEIDIRTH